MAIYLGGETAAEKRNLDELTPRQIVAELDKYVVGQSAAKRAVPSHSEQDPPSKTACRDRRGRIAQEYPDDRLDRRRQNRDRPPPGSLANSPFIKVEASKFTEVGYMGRDVESMIRS
jgi:ATP-dependent HslUV protease ATP-binding subunit HslU